MTINAASGLIGWTPTSGQVGRTLPRCTSTTGTGAPRHRAHGRRGSSANVPPTITSTPVLTATVGAAYSYNVNATDPNGGDVDRLAGYSAGRHDHQRSERLIGWTPTSAQVGSNTVAARVDDGHGGSTTQSFTINVAAANVPPTITSTPVLTATVGAAYSYDANATDPNAGDVLTYSLNTAPAGMNMNAVNGLIGWTPTSGQVGANAVTVRVDDGHGGSATQSFTINVAAANVAPTITSTPVSTATVGAAYSYDVNATDPNAGDVLTYSLDTAPAGMTINAASGLIVIPAGAYASKYIDASPAFGSVAFTS